MNYQDNQGAHIGGHRNSNRLTPEQEHWANAFTGAGEDETQTQQEREREQFEAMQAGSNNRWGNNAAPAGKSKNLLDGKDNRGTLGNGW